MWSVCALHIKKRAFLHGDSETQHTFRMEKKGNTRGKSKRYIETKHNYAGSPFEHKLWVITDST